MALSSGPVTDISLPAGEVLHAVSASRYRIRPDGEFHFARAEAAGDRAAAFFIGSGTVARSLLWREQGFLFQLPVSWFASSGWQMSPGFEEQATLNLARPIEPECLGCHATAVRHVAGTQNGYQWPPTTEPGIGCERCHGPGGGHVASGGRAAIVNPSKLPARRRDSICAQCHLTGVERVAKIGRDLADFRPGDDWSAYAAVFVWNGTAAGDAHVTSHFERLETSRCKQASGDKLWCGYCHDAHSVPTPAGRAEYYRSKCMSCHEAGLHTAANADCISCHMPSRTAQDVGRARVTDHAIAKLPSSAHPDQSDLRSFGEPAGERELGLAWSRIANVRKRPEDFEKASAHLRRAYESGARDVETLTALAFIEDRAGNDARANQFYEEARRLNPPAEALVNLGSAYASQGRLLDALPLWRQATERSPGLEAGWIKLASAYAALNRKTEAIEAARRCLVYHPDSSRALELLKELER